MAGDYTKPDQQSPEPVPSDYDEDPGRVRLARSVLRRHAVAGDVHELVARRFVAEGLARVLDVGCGEGRRSSPARPWWEFTRKERPAKRVRRGPERRRHETTYHCYHYRR